MRLTVRVTPRGGRDAVDGWARDAAGQPFLKVRVSAAPSDGAANAAVVDLLAAVLGVARTSITLKSGAAARIKLLEISTLSEAELFARLGPPPP